MLSSANDIAREVQRLGFLPFFAGEIEGFSIEEQIAPDYWFPDDDLVEGAWMWKNDIIIDANCAYGKFYLGKACFVSLDWFPELVNHRRSTAQLSADEQFILDTVKQNGSLLSREIKKQCGYNRPPRPRNVNPLERLTSHNQPRPEPLRKGFDTAITHLQMTCHLLTACFEYSYTRDGKRYGWSIARYCTPEDFFGPECFAIDHSPEQSRQRLLDHISSALPQASARQIERLVG